MTARVQEAFFALLRAGMGLAPQGLETGQDPGTERGTGTGQDQAKGLSIAADLSPEEWEELYAQARRHTVLGTIFDGLETLPSTEGIPMGLLARWAMTMDGMEKTGRLHEAVIKAQQEAWTRHGLKGYVLKGRTVAAMYPNPGHRTSGDIDWWFGSEEDWRKANSIAASNTGSLTEDSDGDVHYTFKGVVVEHHRRWNDASSRKARKALAGMKPDEPLAVLAMLNLHILKHAMVLGIGLRQVCDLVMASRYLEYDAEALAGLLERCGLSKWTGLLSALTFKCFGVSIVPAEGEVNPKDVDMLLAMILADGNFGLETGRDARSVAGSVWGRAGLFLRYAPAEFVARLWKLMKGRIVRNSNITDDDENEKIIDSRNRPDGIAGGLMY